METTTLTNLKNKLSSIIDRVKKGQSILILEHGRPVAQLSKANIPESMIEGFILAMERDGLISHPEMSSLDPDTIRPIKVTTGKKFSVVQTLIQERKEGR